MIYGIGTGGGLVPGGIVRFSDSARPAGHETAGGRVQDSVSFSMPPQGEQAKVQELTARLSAQLRVRPSKAELEDTRKQVLSGAYQPDARDIAARMLLIMDGEV